MRCNPLWPVCVYDSFYKAKQVSYFCFRVGVTPRIIPDYFSFKTDEEDDYEQSNGINIFM